MLTHTHIHTQTDTQRRVLYTCGLNRKYKKGRNIMVTYFMEMTLLSSKLCVMIRVIATLVTMLVTMLEIMAAHLLICIC